MGAQECHEIGYHRGVDAKVALVHHPTVGARVAGLRGREWLVIFAGRAHVCSAIRAASRGDRKGGAGGESKQVGARGSRAGCGSNHKEGGRAQHRAHTWIVLISKEVRASRAAGAAAAGADAIAAAGRRVGWGAEGAGPGAAKGLAAAGRARAAGGLGGGLRRSDAGTDLLPWVGRLPTTGQRLKPL